MKTSPAQLHEIEAPDSESSTASESAPGTTRPSTVSPFHRTRCSVEGRASPNGPRQATMPPLPEERWGPQQLFPPMERMAYELILSGIRGEDALYPERTAAALVLEGARGPTMRAILARRLVNDVAEYSQNRAFLNAARRHMGPSLSVNEVRHLEQLEKMLERSDRRFHNDVDAFTRLTSPGIPNVQIRAHQAAVQVQTIDREDTPDE